MEKINSITYILLEYAFNSERIKLGLIAGSIIILLFLLMYFIGVHYELDVDYFEKIRLLVPIWFIITLTVLAITKNNLNNEILNPNNKTIAIFISEPIKANKNYIVDSDIELIKFEGRYYDIKNEKLINKPERNYDFKIVSLKDFDKKIEETKEKYDSIEKYEDIVKITMSDLYQDIKK
ncbi:hypothetical protein [Helcococcus kunzii]|uniref:hypothetical protein n=1 Tax=Helcococcus kunzii TaxID=40091 RepID=UPI0024ADCEE3|nr:hypothetical protein [Helcococcus kunzii]